MSARFNQVCDREHFLAFCVNRNKIIRRTYHATFTSQAIYVHCSQKPPSPTYSISPTNFSSNFLTSFLNTSTSRQQSSGLRSFTLKQLTTAFRAFSTSGGRSFSTFRSDSVRFNFAISSCTFCEDCSLAFVAEKGVRASFSFEAVDWGSSDDSSEGSSEESFARTASKVSDSRFWIFSSSAATRSAMWSSRVLAREEFVWTEF
jgi:hypothetical protein